MNKLIKRRVLSMCANIIGLFLVSGVATASGMQPFVGAGGHLTQATVNVTHAGSTTEETTTAYGLSINAGITSPKWRAYVQTAPALWSDLSLYPVSLNAEYCVALAERWHVSGGGHFGYTLLGAPDVDAAGGLTYGAQFNTQWSFAAPAASGLGVTFGARYTLGEIILEAPVTRDEVTDTQGAFELAQQVQIIAVLEYGF